MYLFPGHSTSYHAFDIIDKDSTTTERRETVKPKDHIGVAPTHGYIQKQPKNYFFESVLTFLCFPPTAIAAVFFALKVKRLWSLYNYPAAYNASKRARNLALISFLFGLIMWIVLLTLWKIKFKK